MKEKGTFPKTITVPDEKLVELFVTAKDESAFEEIIDRHIDRVYGLALRITRNPHNAERVLQEVFVNLMRELNRFREEPKLSSWLCRIAVDTSYTHIRAEKKYESDVGLENYIPYDRHGTLHDKIMDKDWSNKPDETLFGKEAREIVERVVSELPESYRIVFLLRDVEGFSDEEVAKILELSVPAVKSRLHRARLFLRDKLSDYFYKWSK